MYTCTDCNLFFENANQAVYHYVEAHEQRADVPEETKVRLNALLDWQLTAYAPPVTISRAEYQSLLDR